MGATDKQMAKDREVLKKDGAGDSQENHAGHAQICQRPSSVSQINSRYTGLAPSRRSLGAYGVQCSRHVHTRARAHTHTRQCHTAGA